MIYIQQQKCDIWNLKHAFRESIEIIMAPGQDSVTAARLMRQIKQQLVILAGSLVFNSLKVSRFYTHL